MANTHWKTARRIAKDARIELREAGFVACTGDYLNPKPFASEKVPTGQGSGGFAGEYLWQILSSSGGSVSMGTLAGVAASQIGGTVNKALNPFEVLDAVMHLGNTVRLNISESHSIQMYFNYLVMDVQSIDGNWFNIRIAGGRRLGSKKHSEIITYSPLFIGTYNYEADSLFGAGGNRIKAQWWKRPFVRRSTQKARFKRNEQAAPSASSSRSRSSSNSYSDSGSSSGYDSD